MGQEEHAGEYLGLHSSSSDLLTFPSAVGWEADLPDGTEVTKKYNNDYSRFDQIEDIEEKEQDTRDFYFDERGGAKLQAFYAISTSLTTGSNGH